MSTADCHATPRFRAMLLDDVDDVVTIERSASGAPWTPEVFRACIQVGYHCAVLEVEHEVVGYTVMAVEAGAAHILNLCIASTHRGRGLGRAALDYVVAVAREREVERILLEVRPTNGIAQRLYRSAGFTHRGRRKNYYQTESGYEDAIVLALELYTVAAPWQLPPPPRSGRGCGAKWHTYGPRHRNHAD
jgi:[ribosomal protein S18]-alanine N-acetyltransferase